MTNYVALEPEGSSPHSQQPAIDPYSEPAETTPHPLPPTQSPWGNTKMNIDKKEWNGMDWTRLRNGPLAVSCEHDNKISRFLKGQERMRYVEWVCLPAL
jgi:hypothetical protein